MRRSENRILPRKLKLCVMLSSLALTVPVAAWAQTPAAIAPAATATQSYNVPSGPMAAALQQLATIGGHTVQFAPGDMAALTSAPVSGELTPLQALTAALSGSALAVNVGPSGTFIVSRSTAMQTVTVVARRNEAETSFKADYSKTTTRSGASLRDVPHSITIITSKVLQTQQATSLQDSLRNVSGVAFTQSPQGLPTFSIRGFSQTSTTTNGISDSAATQTNVFGVERLEVLKGPQAILAGAGSLGGGVNVVMKKPQADTVRDVTLQYGTHNDATGAADLSGALTDDKRLTYRLIGSAAKSEGTMAGYNGRKDNFLMPALRWKDASTDLIVRMSYGQQDIPVPAYTFALRNGTILPRPDMLLSNAGDGFSSKQQRLFYQLEQKLAPWLTFESRMQRSINDDLLHLYSPGGLLYGSNAANAALLGTGIFFPGNNQTYTRTTSGDHFLRADFSTWNIEHNLVVGYNQVDTDTDQTQNSGATRTVGLYPASGFMFPDSYDSAQVIQTLNKTNQKQKSFYLQDLMKWGDWNLQLNARRTEVQAGGHTVIPSSNYDQDKANTDQSKTTPGVGVVYNVTADASVYASVANGFAGQVSNLCGGGIAPPQSTRNKEVGAKFDFLDDKLALTTSVFQLDQSNLLQYQAVNRCYVLRDAKQTSGAEMDLQGQLARGWNAILNYTYSTYRDMGANGTLFPGLPKHKMSLWSVYDFQNATLKGFGFGFGLSASGHTIGSSSAATQFMLPGQAQIDASVYYHHDKWNVTAGVKNLADRTLYGVSTSNSYIPVLEGRNFMLTVHRSFD